MIGYLSECLACCPKIETRELRMLREKFITLNQSNVIKIFYIPDFRRVALKTGRIELHDFGPSGDR